MKKLILMISMILLAVSCDLSGVTPEEEETNQEQVVPGQPEDTPQDPALPEIDVNTGFEAPASVPVLSESEISISDALNLFGVNVLSEIVKENADESVMISPLSISMALSMCLNGAAGDTQAQLAALLGLEGKNREDIASYYKKTLGRLMTLDQKVVFNSANALWYDDEFPIKDGYLSGLGQNYDASAYKMDFDEGKILVDVINKWVKDKTAGTIDKIIDTAPQKPLALANALYFKANWAVLFCEKTKEGIFKGAKGEVNTDYFFAMFHEYDRLEYVSQDGYQVLILPYGNEKATERFEMVVILPEEGTPIGEALSWTAAKGEAIMRSMGPDNIVVKAHVEIPCFKIGSPAMDLRNLFMAKYPLPFTDEADFSGISETSDMPLFISQIMHKTYIGVDQKGTEASSVAYVGYATSDGEEHVEPDPIDFKADHPFIFVIRDSGSGSNIFVGVKQ